MILESVCENCGKEFTMWKDVHNNDHWDLCYICFHEAAGVKIEDYLESNRISMIKH